MILDHLLARLKSDEGTGPVKDGRHLPYFDCCGKFFRECRCKRQGKLTIGYGHNLEARGLRRKDAESILENDDVANTVREVAASLPWVADLDPVRQAVLVMMAFQMGIGGLIEFKRTLKIVQSGDYETAAVYMLESKWATEQSPERALRLAEMMRTGAWL